MGATGGGARPPLEELRRKPYSFDFFQAVRLLERAALGANDGNGDGTRPPGKANDDNRASRAAVGLDNPPDREPVRFRALPSSGFPSAPIADFRENPSNGNGAPDPKPTHGTPPEMVVTFLGLTGPQGALPRHYTTLLCDRVRQKDFALRDYLDLFNHRLVSLFYRAWQKYHFTASYERRRLAGLDESHDVFTRALYALIGFGTAGLRGRSSVPDEALLHYSGALSHRPRSATQLAQLVSDYFGVPADLLQFQGQWLYLAPEDLSSFPTGTRSNANNQLGVTTVIGERVWDVQARFRVRLGPLSYAEFCLFMPEGGALRPLCEIVRLYSGPEYDFDVQPVLKGQDVPPTRLGDASGVKPSLGRNVWMFSKPFDRDVEDVVFAMEDV